MTLTALPLDRVALAILIASLGILGSAFAFQYLGGLQPCPLCIAQRWPYAATLGLSAFAVAVARDDRRAARLLIGAAGLVFAIGAGIAIHHVGVEQHWWTGSAECTAPAGGANLSVAEMTARLFATPVVRCDEIPWSFLGLSMAAWNALVSSGLAASSLLAAWKAET